MFAGKPCLRRGLFHFCTSIADVVAASSRWLWCGLIKQSLDVHTLIHTHSVSCRLALVQNVHMCVSVCVHCRGSTNCAPTNDNKNLRWKILLPLLRMCICIHTHTRKCSRIYISIGLMCTLYETVPAKCQDLFNTHYKKITWHFK